MTELNIDIECDACGAEPGEPCRPLCIGVPEERIGWDIADGPAPGVEWYDVWRDDMRGE